MKLRAQVLIAVAIFVLPHFASAVCTSFYPTVADGRNALSSYDVPASTSVAVFAPAAAGHSYSVEFSAPFASVGTPGQFFINQILAGGDCTSDTADTGGFVQDTTFADPELYVASGHRRVSFFANSTEFIYAVIKNTDAASDHAYRVTITDTTLYNPRWSTTQGYITVYGFQNTTTQTVHGSLFLRHTFGGTGPARYALNGGAGIAPGAQLLVAMGPGLTIDMPADEGGDAVLIHDAPPGGLVVDAYFANAVSLVPAVFAPRNSQH